MVKSERPLTGFWEHRGVGDLEMCFPFSFPSFPADVSFSFSWWPKFLGLDGRAVLCSGCSGHNEAISALVEQLVGEGFHITTRFLWDGVSKRLWMQGWSHFLTEVRLEVDPMKSDRGSSGLCPVLPNSATLNTELAVRTTG